MAQLERSGMLKECGEQEENCGSIGFLECAVVQFEDLFVPTLMYRREKEEEGNIYG